MIAPPADGRRGLRHLWSASDGHENLDGLLAARKRTTLAAAVLFSAAVLLAAVPARAAGLAVLSGSALVGAIMGFQPDRAEVRAVNAP